VCAESGWPLIGFEDGLGPCQQRIALGARRRSVLFIRHHRAKRANWHRVSSKDVGADALIDRWRSCSSSWRAARCRRR